MFRSLLGDLMRSVGRPDEISRPVLIAAVAFASAAVGFGVSSASRSASMRSDSLPVDKPIVLEVPPVELAGANPRLAEPASFAPMSNSDEWVNADWPSLERRSLESASSQWNSWKEQFASATEDAVDKLAKETPTFDADRVPSNRSDNRDSSQSSSISPFTFAAQRNESESNLPARLLPIPTRTNDRSSSSHDHESSHAGDAHDDASPRTSGLWSSAVSRLTKGLSLAPPLLTRDETPRPHSSNAAAVAPDAAESHRPTPLHFTARQLAPIDGVEAADIAPSLSPIPSNYIPSTDLSSTGACGCKTSAPSPESGWPIATAPPAASTSVPMSTSGATPYGMTTYGGTSYATTTASPVVAGYGASSYSTVAPATAYTSPVNIYGATTANGAPIIAGSTAYVSPQWTGGAYRPTVAYSPVAVSPAMNVAPTTAGYAAPAPSYVPSNCATVARPIAENRFTAYSPVQTINVNNARVGRGLLGAPTVYVPGQPVRNFFRWLLP